MKPETIGKKDIIAALIMAAVVLISDPLMTFAFSWIKMMVNIIVTTICMAFSWVPYVGFLLARRAEWIGTHLSIVAFYGGVGHVVCQFGLGAAKRHYADFNVFLALGVGLVAYCLYVWIRFDSASHWLRIAGYSIFGGRVLMLYFLGELLRPGASATPPSGASSKPPPPPGSTPPSPPPPPPTYDA